MTFQVLQQINGFGLMELQLKGLQIDGTAAKGSSDRLETLRCGVLCARLLPVAVNIYMVCSLLLIRAACYLN